VNIRRAIEQDSTRGSGRSSAELENLKTNPRTLAAAALSAIFVLALVVRLAGIRFGLPCSEARPDETTVVQAALQIGGKDFTPHFFNYPSLYPSLLAFSLMVYSVAGRLTGRPGGFAGLTREFAIDPTNLLLIDRALSACLGVATVWAVYAIGRRMAGRGAGILSALFLALAYLHVRESHFGTVDVPMTFFASLALFLALKGYQDGRTSSFLASAFCAGLAASTKYNAIAVVASTGLAYVLRRLEAPSSPAIGKEPGGTVAAGALAAPAPVGEMLATAFALVAGFLVGTPYLFWDWKQFVRDSQLEVREKMTGGPWGDLELGAGWVRHLVFSLPEGLGWAMIAAAAVGSAIALRRRPKTALVLLAFPFFWWLGVGKSHTVFVRYALPLVPPLCVLAALAVDGIAAFLADKLRAADVPRSRRGAAYACVAFGLAVAILAVPAYRLVRFDAMLRRTDSRVVVGRWIEENLPSGATVGLSGYVYVRPSLWSVPAQVDAQIGRMHRGISDEELRARRDYVASHAPPAFHLLQFDERAEAFADLWTALPAASPPDYVVAARYPLAAYISVTPGLQARLDREYTLVRRFDSFAADVPAERFDQHDAFYLPYTSTRDVVRPGPTFEIYRRSVRGMDNASIAPAASAPATK
jgi:4-amino-4-deoxy-L-arabinose transferase-like glycosyltransferase